MIVIGFLENEKVAQDSLIMEKPDPIKDDVSNSKDDLKYEIVEHHQDYLVLSERSKS